MSTLNDFADLFSDLAEDVSNDIDRLIEVRPNGGSALALWQIQMSRMSSKANDLQNVAGQLRNLDAQQLLDDVAHALDNIKVGTADAQAAIKQITDLNQVLDLLGKFISLGVDIASCVANPGAGLSGLASGVSDLADAIKKYHAGGAGDDK